MFLLIFSDLGDPHIEIWTGVLQRSVIGFCVLRHLLNGTARYAHLLLAPAKGFGQGLFIERIFFLFKKNTYMYTFLAESAEARGCSTNTFDID